jgi:hypothetical protein
MPPIYVKPSWQQNLAQNALNPMAARMLEGQADQQQGALRGQMEGDAQNWMGQMPQPTQQELAGPPAEGEVMGQETIQPSMQQKMQWAQRGQNNPLTKALAAQYGADTLIKEPERQEARQFKREEAAATRVAKMEQIQAQLEAKRDELKMRLEDRGLDRASREQLVQQQQAILYAIAKMNDETKRYGIDMNADLRRDIAKLGRDGKPVSPTVIKQLSGLRTQADDLKDVHDTFKDDYGGLAGGVGGTVGGYLPKSMGGDKYREATDWWKGYENQAALVERHEKFGTALSAGERAAWQKATIAPGMSADTIKRNLKERARISNLLYERTVGEYEKAGHGVSGAFPTSGAGGAPETKTIGGKTYVKRDGKWFEQ